MTSRPPPEAHAGVGRPGRRPRARGGPTFAGPRTRESLEVDAVLAVVAGFAASPAGRERVQQLTPSWDLPTVQAELDRVDAMGAVLERDGAFAMPAVPDVARILDRLATSGAVLDGRELQGVRALLGAGHALADLLERADPSLHPLAAALVRDPALERLIDDTIDDDGTVLDRASPELARLRRELHGARARLVKQLESVVSELPERFRVADASVTVRQGRFVIPVRREGKGSVGGIVHDESASGQTLFVEPPQAVEGMNRLRETELAEAREVHRILRDRSERLRPHADVLRASLAACVELDALQARARYAASTGAVRPAFSEPGGPFRIRRGRHPLLLARAGTVVPFDLDLSGDERALVISGPNAGGKTVLLKAVGLLVTLLQSGVLPPVGPGSVFPLFRRVFADIGDRQSIAEDLSTFSAHLAVLRDILELADDGALVLIDEMGTGTDPAEGAALAEAVLGSLVERGARVLATSHLGALKRVAEGEARVVNASLRFDAERMEPTFEFIKGRPGRSYGLAMARRAGLPADVLARAEARVDDTELRMEQLLARIERQERQATEDAARAQRAAEAAEARARDLEAREAALTAREKTAERDARAEARRILLEARQEVEDAIAEVRTAADLDRSAHEARRALEQAAQRQREQAPTKRGGPREGQPAVQPGDRVRVGERGGVGTVVEAEPGRITVELDNGLRVRVPDVERLEEAPPPKRRARGSSWTPLEHQAAHEVDLRGLRVDEVDAALRRALDHAVLGDLPSLRIIHGKGSGALRGRVSELLADEPRVESYRPGADGEGGTGVTVASLR